MKTRIRLTLFFLLFLTGTAQSQMDFRDGFIITLTNDTIKGQVAYRSNSKNYTTCIYKLNKKKTTYLPNQIIGFGYDRGKFFSSQILSETFVEVLVTGHLSLYKAKSKYILEKGDSLTELTSNREIVEVGGQYGYQGHKRWRGLIYGQIKDCTSDDYDLMDKLKFDEKRLTKLVVNYNKCQTASFSEIKASQPWTKINIGLAVGINTSTIKTTRKQFDFFPHLADEYVSTDPSFGLVLEFSSPRLTDKIAVQVETHFIHSTFSSFLKLYRGEATDYHDTYFEMSALSIPASIKYNFLQKPFNAYVQAGVSIDQHLRTRSILLSERVIRNVVTIEPESPAFEFSNTRFGFWGGIGLRQNFNKFGIDLSARYIQLSAPSKSDSFTLSQNRLSINLIFFRK